MEKSKTPPPNTLPSEKLSPNANLKMLISVLSPEIKNRPALENNFAATSSKLHENFSIRSAKSLSLLCQRFLCLYPEYPKDNNHSLHLDQVASQLRVERRRIYDIINILESLEMVTKICKNKYQWHGKIYLIDCLKRLKNYGESYLSKSLTPNIVEFYENFFGVVGENMIDKPQGISRLSLGILSQKFLIALLLSETKIMSMEDMAKIIEEEDYNDDEENKKPKTRVRRLYDIANVLSSLKLVEKIRIKVSDGTRKPAFTYIGPDLAHYSNHNILVKQLSPYNTRHSIFKHASFNTTQANEGKQIEEDSYSADNFSPRPPVIYKTPILLKRNHTFTSPGSNNPPGQHIRAGLYPAGPIQKSILFDRGNFAHPTPPSAFSTPINGAFAKTLNGFASPFNATSTHFTLRDITHAVNNVPKHSTHKRPAILNRTPLSYSIVDPQPSKKPKLNSVVMPLNLSMNSNHGDASFHNLNNNDSGCYVLGTSISTYEHQSPIDLHNESNVQSNVTKHFVEIYHGNTTNKNSSMETFKASESTKGTQVICDLQDKSTQTTPNKKCCRHSQCPLNGEILNPPTPITSHLYGPSLNDLYKAYHFPATDNNALKHIPIIPQTNVFEAYMKTYRQLCDLKALQYLPRPNPSQACTVEDMETYEEQKDQPPLAKYKSSSS